MEEADLLRERLQAITDKRRIREEIAKKRREIEEVKLKLQYLKKKSLREQWLMDGLSGQNDEEEEAMRAQAQEEQHKAELLQSDIDRIESEISALETQEMNISENEELILERLRKVEKTAEDIIKEINGDIQPEPIQYIYSAIPDIPKSYTPTLARRNNTPVQEPDAEPEKKAMYAMEISVEKDLRTGKCQVLSSAKVTPQEFLQKGTKVYDDGRKSVYAVQSNGKASDDEFDELSPLEVEELLRKASEKKTANDVEYHEPVFSSPYSQSCTPSKGERGVVSPGPNGFHIASKTPSPLQPDNFRRQDVQGQEGQVSITDYIPDPETKQNPHFNPYVYQSSINGQEADLNEVYDGDYRIKEDLIQEPEEEQQRITPESDLDLEFDRTSPLSQKEDLVLNIVNSMPDELNCSQPISMIFMGYQNAESDEEDEKMQAELVVISSDEEENDSEPTLSYHPRGYYSKIFQPRSDNVHRSEVRPSVFRNHNPGEHIRTYKKKDPGPPVCRKKVPQLEKHVPLKHSKIPSSHT